MRWQTSCQLGRPSMFIQTNIALNNYLPLDQLSVIKHFFICILLSKFYINSIRNDLPVLNLKFTDKNFFLLSLFSWRHENSLVIVFLLGPKILHFPAILVFRLPVVDLTAVFILCIVACNWQISCEQNPDKWQEIWGEGAFLGEIGHFFPQTSHQNHTPSWLVLLFGSWFRN